jgi:hypothetical protein
MKCRCLPDPETQTATLVDHVRLFRNRPDIRWKYRIHEQILPAIRATGGEVPTANVVIQHVGYLDPALRAQKEERNLRLLHLDYQDDPNGTNLDLTRESPFWPNLFSQNTLVRRALSCSWMNKRVRCGTRFVNRISGSLASI